LAAPDTNSTAQEDTEDEWLANLSRYLVAARWRQQKEKMAESQRLGIDNMDEERDRLAISRPR